MAAGNNAKRAEGLGVDAAGGPVVDPTKNVLDLVQAAIKRQDDLRAKDREISDLQHAHAEFLDRLRAEHNAIVGQLREGFQEKIAHAESGRLDSIRQVDREEVAKTAVAANNAINTLAKQTTELQQTLARQVTDTAAIQETRSSSQYNDITKRLQAVELSLSEGKGKQQVADPAMERLALVVEKLAAKQESNVGKGEGINLAWVVMLGAVSFIVGLITIGGFVFVATRGGAPASVAPQVIYVPAPAAGNSAPVPGVR